MAVPEAAMALAFFVSREIFRDALRFGITPFDAALSRAAVASLSVVFTCSNSFTATAAVTFLTAVLIAELTERFRSLRFSDCRALFSADG